MIIEKSLIEKCKMCSKQNWLYYHLSQLIIFIMFPLYLSIVIPLLYFKDIYDVMSIILIVGSMLTIFIEFNPDELKKASRKRCLLFMYIPILRIISSMSGVIYFWCYIVMGSSIYLLFLSIDYSQKALPVVTSNIKKTFENYEQVLEKLRYIVKRRIHYRNTIFKMFWGILSVIIFPSIIGLMSIYSKEIRSFLSFNGILLTITIAVSFLFLFFMFFTSTLYEFIQFNQYAFIPDRVALTKTIYLLRSIDNKNNIETLSKKF